MNETSQHNLAAILRTSRFVMPNIWCLASFRFGFSIDSLSRTHRKKQYTSNFKVLLKILVCSQNYNQKTLWSFDFEISEDNENSVNIFLTTAPKPIILYIFWILIEWGSFLCYLFVHRYVSIQINRD